MVHPLTTVPNPILRMHNADITVFDDALRNLVFDMFETMVHAKGVGLAAPQIGKNLRLFVADDGKQRLAIANPEITFSSKEKKYMEEGCLSIPGHTVDVPRPIKVRVNGIDALTGVPVVIKAKGFLAKILQHEIDHLNATLIADYEQR